MLLDDYLERLNQEMIAHLRPQVADDIRRDNYYGTRVEEGALLSNLEREVIKYIMSTWASTRENWTSLIEICAGVGQLSLALACLGFRPWTNEISHVRADMGAYLDSKLNRLGYALVWLKRPWQEADLSEFELVICTNAVSSNCWWKKDRDKLQGLLDAGKHLIIQPKLYGTVWEDGVDEQRVLSSPREHWIVPDKVVHWWPND